MKNLYCILCKHPKLTLVSPQVRDSKNHKVMKCKKCGHVQLNPVPSQKEDDRFYDENLQDKNVNDVGTIDRAYNKMIEDTIRRIDVIKKITPKKGKILEIGSGHGFFLEMMKKEGFDMTGIDISKEKRRIAKKVTKVKVLDVNINEENLNLGPFDAIVLFHVLEHIADPVMFLKNIKKILKPKGVVVVEVPNCNDFQLDLNKPYRNFYWQRAHIHYYTPNILKWIFKVSGLSRMKIIGTHRYSVENMFSWKITNKPQMDEPVYNLPKEYEWIEKPYKHYLEKTLKCDTMVVVAHNG